ncbi:MAG: hypothetical protein V1492_02840 [Candidatus Micrarchaeota archaeon]
MAAVEKKQPPNSGYSGSPSSVRDFSKGIARLGAGAELSEETIRGAQAAMKKFKELQLSFYREISIIKKEGKNNLFERAAIGLYLYDAVDKLYAPVMSKNDVGIYSQFATIRQKTSELLSNDYFQLSTEKLNIKLMVLEAFMMACGESCGVQVKSIVTAYPEYIKTVTQT